MWTMWRKEGNVLLNDTLNTIYFRLYGVRHMIKGNSDSERGNPLPPHGLIFPIRSKGSCICIIRHTTAFATSVVEHWLERELAQWVHFEWSIRRPIAHERTLLPVKYMKIFHYNVQVILQIWSIACSIAGYGVITPDWKVAGSTFNHR